MHFTVAEVQLHFSRLVQRILVRLLVPHGRIAADGCTVWHNVLQLGHEHGVRITPGSKQTNWHWRAGRRTRGKSGPLSGYNKMAHGVKRTDTLRQISQHFSVVRWQKHIFNSPWLGLRFFLEKVNEKGLIVKFFASTRRFRIQSGPTPR
jgi:hypothetical protein